VSSLERDAAVAHASNDLKTAVELYTRALTTYERLEDSSGQEFILNQLVSIYRKQGDVAREEETKRKLDALPESVTDALRKAATENRLQSALHEIRDTRAHQPGKYYFGAERDLNDFGYDLLREQKVPEAIEVFELNVEAFPNSANTYDSLAEAYMKAGKTDEALKYYEKALDVAVKTHDEYTQAFSNYGLGQLSLKAGKKDEAREYYRKALQLATKSDNRRIQKDATEALKNLGTM
jgi:pentatricopeptide repeat protein